MKNRILGRTGLKVSEIGFGGWAIGGGAHQTPGYGPTDDAQSIRALEAALEHGVTFIDTAASYGAGHSEELIGRVVSAEAYRDFPVIIATKAGMVRKEGQPAYRDFSRASIEETVADSLHRLNRDTIDLLQLHNPSDEVLQQGDVFETLHRLKDAGKIRFAGVSVTSPDQGVMIIKMGEAASIIDTIQVVYNVLQQEARKELFPLAAQHNIGIIVREPLLNGLLTDKFHQNTVFPENDIRSRKFAGGRLDIALRRVNQIRFIQAGGDYSITEAALRFCLAEPAVATVIPGAKTPAQVEGNVKASDAPLSPELVERAKQWYDEHGAGGSFDRI